MGPEALLRRAGLSGGRATPLAGGDVASVWRAGEVVCKLREEAPEDFFVAEARGLRALAAAGVRVPGVVHVDRAGIVLEYLPPGPADWEGLAAQVARLHGAPAPVYGWDHRIYLGSFPLPSARGDTWRELWTTRRIAPLLQATAPRLGDLAHAVERLVADFEPPVEGPVLLHGDLWSGNLHMSSMGAALIDPSAWWGERGVDLAMMHLFGGFPATFWRAYEARRPVPESVREAIPFYQLYYLLVHVQMFGGAYVGGVERIVSRYG